MTKAAIVTGAGSGVGRAVALRLAGQGWHVAILARRGEALDETVRSAAEGSRPRIHPFPCDVADAAAVAALAAEVVKRFGAVHALVNSAGTNIPRRGFDVLSLEDFHRLIDVNLNGTFHAVHAVLPVMRRQGEGTIVNVVSDAGLIASAKAGPAYVASKFGVTGLTQSINAEERHNGIRACAVFPGDVDTPLLEKRPQPPSAEARQKMLRPEDVAECVMLAINLPHRAVVEQLVVRPR
jgi:NAD(P)-dependent dehydrogenase (short-subunit alcohol dehydrogenase family)